MTKVNLKTLKKMIKNAFSIEQLNEMKVPENEIKDYLNFQVFPVKILVKAEWNYKNENEELEQKLINNLKRNGQVENIQVRELETGYYEVVNGNHRLQACLDIGREYIVAYNHGKISDSQAQRIAIETNETKFESDNVKLAKLFKNIRTEFEIEDLSDSMPYSSDEI